MKTETKIGKYPCDECDRVFGSTQAVRIHKARAHGPGWDTSGNFHRGGVKGTIKRKHLTREETLAQKRSYNARTRAANIAKGLTGAGKVRKRALRSSKPIFGTPWTAERRAKFNSTWMSKRNRRAKFHAKIQEKLQAKKEERNSEHLEDPRAYINNCPQCGYNLVPHYLAAKAAHKYV